MRRSVVSVVPLLLLAACTREPAEQPADAAAPAGPVFVAGGFRTPESVLHDAEQDVYFVANINGSPVEKDGNGYISRLRPDGTVDPVPLAEGGRNGVTLHAPKGMAIVGDTLWVTDIDVLRGFDRRTGAPLATVAVPGSAFLNDVAVGPDGMLHVTDTGFREAGDGSGAPAVYRIGPGHRPERVLDGSRAPAPNGVTATADGEGLLIASFGDEVLREWRPVDDTVREVGRGPGQHDGLEVLPDGRVAASSWVDSSVVAIGPAGAVPLVTGVPSPADIGVDRGRGLVLVPLLQLDRVEAWAVPPAR